MPSIDQTIGSFLKTALGAAEQQPHRRSEILGQTAINLAGLAHQREHTHAAPLLISLAEQLAQAAMQPELSATTDDFHELLLEHAAAREQGFDSDLDIQARSEALHDAKEAVFIQRVSITPASWGKGATLGRSGTFKYNPSGQEINDGVQQSATLAFWQGEPHEAQAITVDLAPVSLPMRILQAPSLGQDISSRPYGLVTYGSDGAITTVKFDAGLGRRLTVVGSYVSIVAGMDAPLAEPGVMAGTMTFAASLGAFAAPSQAPVCLTEYIDNLADGVTTTPIQLPQRANQVLPILSNAALGTVLLKFYGQGAGNVLFSFAYPMGQLLRPIPLTAEAQYFTLKNLTGGQANFRVPIQLSV